MNDLHPIWLLAIIVFAMILPLIGVVLGAYAVFRTKHAQTGLSFMEPRKVNKPSEEPYSYVSDIFPEGEESTGLGNDILTDVAERIREQRIDAKIPTLEDHKKEVEGKK